MPGFRQVGLFGVAVAFTGGLTYLAWNYLWYRKKTERDREEVTRETKKVPRLTSERPIRWKLKDARRQVLVLGLDGAGKTSLMHCLATGSLEQDVSPTEGINAISINKEDVQIEFLEIGGTETLRAYWKKYLCKAQVLVYVVDSTDAPRFPLAKKHLHELVAGDPRLAVVVLANKQDLEGAHGITDLHDALGLAGMGDERTLFLIGTYVKKGSSEMSSGIQDARDFIFQMVSDDR